MKHKLLNIPFVIIAHFFFTTVAHADAVYDPATGIITLSHVLAGDGSGKTESIYATNVQVTAGEILSMGKAWPPYIHPSPWPALIGWLNVRCGRGDQPRGISPIQSQPGRTWMGISPFHPMTTTGRKQELISNTESDQLVRFSQSKKGAPLQQGQPFMLFLLVPRACGSA